MAGFRGTAARLTSLLVLLAGAGVSGCGAFDDAAQADPEPSRRPVLNTIEASDVGDRLTVTAVVTGVSAEQAFTVQDADLPSRGLLVLGAGGVRAQDLVTVTGTVVMFAFTRYRDRHNLGDFRAYRLFESRKALVADRVRSWAGPDGAPGGPGSPAPHTSPDGR